MRENIRQVIYDALAEINATRGGARQLEVSDATVLLGTDSSMESIELVNLIVSTEMLIEERHGLFVELADDQGLWQGEGGLRTVGTFTDYVVGRLEEQLPA